MKFSTFTSGRQGRAARPVIIVQVRIHSSVCGSFQFSREPSKGEWAAVFYGDRERQLRSSRFSPFVKSIGGIRQRRFANAWRLFGARNSAGTEGALSTVWRLGVDGPVCNLLIICPVRDVFELERLCSQTATAMNPDFSNPAFWHRLQFAFTMIYHYLFPQLTMGLVWFIVFWKWKALRTREERFAKAARFWAKIFGLNFALGGILTGLEPLHQP